MSSSPPAQQRLLDQLGISYPVLQAPMAGISTPELAAAVTNAGALGALGLGSSGAAAARKAVARLRSLTRGPFHLNVFCHATAGLDTDRDAAWLAHLAPAFAELGASVPGELRNISPSYLVDEEMRALLITSRPALASFHFGIPERAHLTELREAGVFTAVTATSETEAEAIVRAGADTIIAQGYEAGGHRGIMDPSGPDERLATRELVARLTRAAPVPVIAAGGAMTGSDIGELMELGAAAVQLGSAFVPCPESAAEASHRAQFASAAPGATEMTTAISGRPARGFRNRLSALGLAPGAPAPAPYPRAYDAAKQLHAAASARGDSETFAAHWAGGEAHRSRAMPAGELVAVLVDELAAYRSACSGAPNE